MNIYDSLVTTREITDYQEVAGVSTVDPVMSGKVKWIPWKQPPIILTQEPTPDTPVLWNEGGGVRVNPTSIPIVMKLDETDKTSRGVFEKPIEHRLVPTGSVFDRLENYESKPDTPILNATLLNNPAVENFETVKLGNPLVANYQDSTAILNGQDDPRFLASSNAPSPVSDEPLPQQPPQEQATGAWLLRALGLRDSAYKETGVFIVGAIILAIGIFALTR